MWSVNALFALHEFLVVGSLDRRSSEIFLLPHLYKPLESSNKITDKFCVTDFTAKHKAYFYVFKGNKKGA